jgi:GNAT superfamily N-acetyltransferase
MSLAVQTRRADAGDLPFILELLRESMGRSDDKRFEALFLWKHLNNSFGPSPMWVACDGDRIVAFRAFMCWEFERGGEVIRAVRAVDTATHPEYQGRGLFTQLTTAALPELAAEGVQFVFNTPNDQSRPGYLKMGWQTVGRARACVRPLSVGGALRLARNRVPASHWSAPASFGISLGALLEDPALDGLLAAMPNSPVLRTSVSRPFLEWRYASDVVQYRAVVGSEGIEDGVALVRTRARGDAREVVIAALLVPAHRNDARRDLLREVRKVTRLDADYLLAIGSVPGLVPSPQFGPIVTTRDVAMTAPRTIRDFELVLGDVELF